MVFISVIVGSKRLAFFKERLGLKLTHKRITTKVVLPVSRVRVIYRGSYKCVKRGSYDVKLLKSPKVRR